MLKTLGQFIIEKQADFPFAKGELSRLLRDIGIAAKHINREVNKAGIAGLQGANGTQNAGGETQQRLDVFADEQFHQALCRGGECCLIVSEEREEATLINPELSGKARYVVAIDPLDGSSNIDVNIPIGSIFSIHRRESTEGPAVLSDALQAGDRQVAAGYIIYGSSTMLVYTTGKGVNGFTLDPSLGEFCLSHPDMRIPENGTVYSVNESKYRQLSEGLRRYIDDCRRTCTARYTGSMVADLHRNLIQGGIFLYPGTLTEPGGKLRLVYECNPMAFITEQAGGKASNGQQRILGLPVEWLHQRSPLLIGSAEMVSRAEAFLTAELDGSLGNLVIPL